MSPPWFVVQGALTGVVGVDCMHSPMSGGGGDSRTASRGVPRGPDLGHRRRGGNSSAVPGGKPDSPSLTRAPCFLCLPLPRYDKYCADHFKDNHCDQGCNSEECGWDGLDCAADQPENLAEGTLVIVVLLPPEQLLQDARSFLRALGTLLHTNLRIKRDAQGDLMVYPYYGERSAAMKKQRMTRRSLPDDDEQEVDG